MERIATLEREIAVLRQKLNEKEKELYDLRQDWTPFYTNVPDGADTNQPVQLSKWAIERYSRQILLSSIGANGQAKLCGARVLVVGAGGLGCPAALYLAAAGVGEIGIVDYDTVDLTNLHRQVLHGEGDQGLSKVHSAANALRRINSRVKVTPYNTQLAPHNAMDIVNKYDVLLDCSDNPPARYMLNDAAQLSRIPLVSGSALKMEGQLTVYGYRANKNPNEKDPSYVGPCYRCLFPTPPPPEAVGSCSAHGVAGPVPGVIGVLQALEAIKLIVGHTHEQLLVGRMILFDGDDMTFRTVKLRSRSLDCAACSATRTITRLVDYEVFCKAQGREKKPRGTRVVTERRDEEKKRRMTGQSYLGFRMTRPDGKKKLVQDVPKSERRMGPSCSSEHCYKRCKEIASETRQNLFDNFWNNFDWTQKKQYVRSLVDSVTPKRRRLQHQNGISRKGDSKVYHLEVDGNRIPVCMVMFLNTLGLKEAMLRWWISRVDAPKMRKAPIKSINVGSYIDSLPKTQPKCQVCRDSDNLTYLNISDIKNACQLYYHYVKEMKSKGQNPVSRKTFTKVFQTKNIKIFKSKNDGDLCDVNAEHNALPSLDGNESFEVKQIDGSLENVTIYVQW